MMDILIYAYIGGIVFGICMECYGFSQAIKTLPSIGSFFFLVLDVLISSAKYLVWPITLPLRIVQLLFMKSAVDDFNKAIGEYNGYKQEEDNDEDKGS